YLGMLVWPLLALGFFFNIVQRGAASYDRIRDIENETNDIQLIQQTEEIPTGEIYIDIRYFKFTDETAPRLQDIVFS
ncbi:multidrug ABC transporter permease/ATP-binding protein, partial [Staphylococcus felis]|nr:multidrug ABC transporter permease/ATP-binding protein [Staphylococcus felis]